MDIAFSGQVRCDCKKAEGRGQRAEVKKTAEGKSEENKGFPSASCLLPSASNPNACTALR
jgi:hypothetical protein